MLRAGLVAALALALAVGAGCGGDDDDSKLPPKRHEAAVPDGFFGVNGQDLRPMAEDGRLDELNRHLDQIEAGGLDFIRVHVDWPRVEPTPPTESGHSYDFTGLDAWMRALAEHGLAWQLLVTIPTPEWAADPDALGTCGFRAAPENAADMVALLDALARRYGRDGSFWEENADVPYQPVTRYEVGNEPNFGSFWCPTPDPEAYAELLDEAADSIHAVDGRAQVLFGGLAGWKDTVERSATTPAHVSVPEFLSAAVTARPELRQKIDAVAIHAYADDAEGVLAYMDYYRRALRAAGLGELPMAFNEAGWYTHGFTAGQTAIPDELRGGYLTLLANVIGRTNCGIDSFAVHTWITAENNYALLEDWYGIADPSSGEPHESGGDYLAQVQLLEGRGDEAPPNQTADLCAAG